MKSTKLFRQVSAVYRSSRLFQVVAQTALAASAGSFLSGCSCESIVADVPATPPEALSVQCACNVVGQTLDGTTQQTAQLDSTFCVPDAYRTNPGSYCGSPDVEQFMEQNVLGLLDGELPGTCSTAQILVTCTPLLGQEGGQAAPSCIGDCQAAQCDTSHCSEADLLNGSCDCTQGSSCGDAPSAPVCVPSFDGHLVVAPDAPLTLGKGQDGRDVFFSMPGGWLAGSQLAMSMDFDACASDGTCTRMADEATSDASGTFELLGSPCPYASCSLGFHSRFDLTDFEITFDVPHSFTGVQAEVFAAPGAIAVGPTGFGFIQPGNLLVNVTGMDNGVAKVIERQLNDFPVLFTIDWVNRRFRIPSMSVGSAGGEGSITLQLEGTFGSSFASTFDPSRYVVIDEEPDTDGDGINDSLDNCPLVANPAQDTVESPVIVISQSPLGCNLSSVPQPIAEDVCFGGPVTLTSSVTAPPLGTSNITWTATDARGRTTQATQSVTNVAALVGSSLVQVRDRGKVLNGSMVSLGTAIGYVGNDAQIGSFLAQGSLDIRDRTRVLGDLFASGSIRLGWGVSVNSSSVHRSTPPTLGAFPELTVQSFSTGTANVTLEPGRKRSITAGAFNTIKVASRATLTLAAGDYYMNTLQLEPDAKLVLSGQTRLFVRSSLTLRGSIDSPAALPAVIYNGTTAVTLEKNFTGQLVAPKARINLGSGSQLSFQGSFFAKELVVSPAASVTCKATL